jgi:hypothetical protein
MQIATSHSARSDTSKAARESALVLATALGRAPDIVMAYTTEHHANSALHDALRAEFPTAEIIGGTSCGGVMTEAGFHFSRDGVIGLLGICDPEGSYGVGAAALGTSPFAAGAASAEQALAAADRKYESPTLIWCSQPPGCEEQVIAGVQSVVGSRTPIIGGSSADQLLEGRWRQFSSDGVLSDHAVVAALFPSGSYGAAFQSGYAPTGDVGIVTRASGRRVIEIDHAPASEVYRRWAGDDMEVSDTGTIFARSTPTPLGRIVGEADLPRFVLSHPIRLDDEGGLSLFTDITEGDEVHLMRGSPDSLVRRAALVAQDAMTACTDSGSGVAGGLVIYCGGCMLHVRDQMDEVAAQIKEATGGAPFLGAFTFGEQGAIVDSCNRHGNLMVSAVMFD